MEYRVINDDRDGFIRIDTETVAFSVDITEFPCAIELENYIANRIGELNKMRQDLLGD